MSSTAALSQLPVLACVALVLGLRHGIDADHLAAIDAMTRCNAHARPALARRTGLWFATGHGAVVLAVALAVALSAHAWVAPRWLEPVGAWGSVAILVLLGVLNLVAWQRAAPGAAVAPAGWRSAFSDAASRAGSRRAVMGVGALFAVSFDTVSQATLMAATGTLRHGLLTVALLAGTFAVGMALTDGLNGWWVARLMQRPGAHSARASRVMCVAIGAISLGTAALGAAVQWSPAIAAWAGSHAAWLALAIVSTVGLGFVAALLWSPRATSSVGAQAPGA